MHDQTYIVHFVIVKGRNVNHGHDKLLDGQHLQAWIQGRSQECDWLTGFAFPVAAPQHVTTFHYPAPISGPAVRIG